MGCYCCRHSYIFSVITKIQAKTSVVSEIVVWTEVEEVIPCIVSIRGCLVNLLSSLAPQRHFSAKYMSKNTDYH